MLSADDLNTLLSLSRLEISSAEREKLRKDVDSILGYVDQVKRASAETSVPEDAAPVRNVLRPDEDARLPGEYTEDLIAAAPEAEKGYVKVKRILA